MSALINVDIQPDSAAEAGKMMVLPPPRNDGLASDSILPKAVSSQSGVSVSYAPSPEKQWYVLRASYSREQKANDVIVEDGTFTFLPKHVKKKYTNGTYVRTEESLVPNILFVYTTEDKANAYVKETASLPFLTFYYDHFSTKDGKNPPLIVPEEQMLSFAKAIVTDREHVRLIDLEKTKLKFGDKVKVTDGDFKGVVGNVARIAGQQRVVVTIKGLCSVATAYIPSILLEKTQ